MDEKNIPDMFEKLLFEGYIKSSDILNTSDGFQMIYKSLSDILLKKGIVEFPNSEGRLLKCSKFYDDWFLYSVPNGTSHTYGLLKLREQEHDTEDDSPADGDIPGVTISFISFECEALLECISNPSEDNRIKLDFEINRVVAKKGQHHNKALKDYFINAKSEGSYLVANLYIKHIAALAKDGYLSAPEHYRKIVKQYSARKKCRRLSRLPDFIEGLNKEAGYVVCDHERVYIRNPKEPTRYEAAAILATHTGNTTVYSFAAEVEYHARFLTSLAKLSIPFFGRSIYASAIRADMTVGDSEFEGPAPFYRPNSKIVKRQYALHHMLRF